MKLLDEAWELILRGSFILNFAAHGTKVYCSALDNTTFHHTKLVP